MNNEAKRYKFSKTIGPGGVKCPCCRKMHESKRETLRRLNKAARRQGREEARKSAEEKD